MNEQVDLAVQDLDNLYPKLRNNLQFTFQIIKNVPCYVIEDPVNSRYYRIGVNEYKFISLLDGRRSVSEAMRIMADAMAEDALLQNDVVQILHWLGNVKLLETNKLPETNNLIGLSQGVSKLLFPKLPFGNPDKYLRAILPFFRPFLGWGFFVIWFIVVVSAIYLVSSQWPRFASTANRVLSTDNWLHLAIVWVLLKVIHELWHALVCRYHEANVRETGIIFILLIPMGYVDTSSCWNLPSKWKRIHIAFAGMKIELFVAAIAAIIWSETPVGLLNQICYEIVLMASITTIFFNVNPLMRFDGYYALADYLEEVNLYSRAQNYLRYLGKKYVLGVNCSFNESSVKVRTLLFVYGFCAFLWKILIYAGIALGTSLMFLGMGIALTVLYVIAFAVVPLAKLLVYMLFGKGLEKPPLWRSAIALGSIAYLVYAMFTTITWEKGIEAPGVIAYKHEETIRVYCPGLVTEIYVTTGQNVRKGQKIIALQNKQVTTEYNSLLLTIEETKLRVRQFAQQDIVAEKIEREKLLYLERQRKEQQKLLDALTIYAPMDGVVATRNVYHLLGTYQNVGAEIITIFDPREKQLLLAIHQDDIDEYQVLLRNKNLDVYISNLDENFVGSLQNIAPTASTKIIHPALAAVGGGDIPVQSDAEGNYLFVVPFFRAEISLPKIEYLKSGYRGYVRIYEKKKTIGMHFYFMIESWIQKNWKKSS